MPQSQNNSYIYLHINYLNICFIFVIKRIATTNKADFYKQKTSWNKSQMQLKRNIIQISLTVFSALLLALLYSPWGSPDLYNKKSYFAENQGVYFQGKIANASSIANTSEGYSQSEGVFPEYKKAQTTHPAYNGSAKLLSQSAGVVGSGYAAYVNKKKSENSGSADGSFGLSGGSMHATFTSRKQGNNNLQLSSVSIDLSAIKDIFGALSKKESGSYLQTTLQGFESLTTDISFSEVSMSLENESPIQKSSPGDDGIYGEPIPVGEGWIFLIVLVALYAIWKKIRSNKKKLQTQS